MRRGRFRKLRAGVAAGALFIGGWLVWVPSATADVTLVDAIASLRAFTANGDDQTGDVSFTDAFHEEVVSNATRASARANQSTVLGTTEGGFLATIETNASIEAFGRGDTLNEAIANATLRVEFEIDAPTTMLIQGVIGADHSDDTNCSFVRVFASDFVWQADAPVQCDGAGASEVVIDEAIPLDTAGSYQIFIDAKTVAEPPEGADSSDGSASWNLSIGLCPNEFTDGADTISGTPDDDVLCGGGGNDMISGGGGSDVILGGAGRDSLLGGDGNDVIEGGDGGDIRIYGGPGDDVIQGGAGNDGRRQNFSEVLAGGAGNDIILGGPGDELVLGACGQDILGDVACSPDPVPSPGDDDRDLILGGPGQDVLLGDGDGDSIGGGGDKDQIFGGDGNDFIEGGPGNEVNFFDDFPATSGIDGDAGNDKIFGGEGDDLIEGGDGNDRLRGEEGSDKVRGQDGPDCLIGGERKDVLVGGQGGDRLLARDGVRDELRGGPQFDRARIDDVDDVTGVENRNFQGGCP